MKEYSALDIECIKLDCVDVIATSETDDVIDLPGGDTPAIPAN